MLRFHAAYMEWAKTRPPARFDLAGSNVLACSVDDLPGARDAVAFSGRNEEGYAPLIDAIAARYGVDPARVTTATGTSGANFLVCGALLDAGDDVLVERPGYDPLLGAPRAFHATTTRFDRAVEERFALDPDRVRRALSRRTRLIVITCPHNPSGVVPEVEALREVGRIAESAGARVLADEVYLDAAAEARPAASLGDVFITTSSLTKSYGLAALRCGWVIAAPDVVDRIRRTRDVVDGTGSIVAERLGTLAFTHMDRLLARARSIVDTSRASFDEILGAREDLDIVAPPRTTVLFPRLRGVPNADTFVDRLLRERDTAVVPGRFFEAPAHFRIGLGGAAEPLREGMMRIAAALDERAW